MTSQAQVTIRSASSLQPFKTSPEQPDRSVQASETELVLTATDICWQRRVADSRGNPIYFGFTLARAKRSLGAGRFKKLMEAGAFGLAAAQASKLMRIAANDVLANPQHHPNLPTCERTLLALARVDADKLENAIRTGAVRRMMTLEEAMEFTKRSRREEPVLTQEALRALDANRQAAGLGYYILEKILHWPASEQQRASELLTVLAEQMRQPSLPRPHCQLI